MESLTRIRVVLAEDHSVVRQGIRRMLEEAEDIEVVGEASDGEEALELVKRLRPDVLICDIRMPSMTGIQVVRRLKQIAVRTRSLILSAYDDEEYVIETIAAGASGYVLKTADANEFPDTVRRINSGQTVMSPAAADKLTSMLGGALPRAKKKQLTVKEREIVNLAARGLRNKAIAKQLNLSVRTIEGYFSRIFVKLSVSSRVEAIISAKSRLIDDVHND